MDRKDGKQIETGRAPGFGSREEAARRLYEIGVSILRAARDELYIHMHFLDLALSSFIYEMDGDMQTVGTDGLHMFFDPRRLGGLYEESRILVNRAYLHMVFHCIFRHMFLRPPSARLWDVSCDIAVEYMIDRGDYRSTRWSRSLFRRETYSALEKSGQTLHAHRIYKILEGRRLTEEELAALEEEFCVCDHSRWESRQQDRPKNEELENHWRDVDDKLETQMTTIGREEAKGAGELLEQLKVRKGEGADYRSFLGKFASLREEQQIDPDTFDYHFYAYGLSLYKNMPLIEPQETREVRRISDFVIVIDTSMSTARDQVYTFLEKTYEVLSEKDSFFSRFHVHILQCDEQVRSDVLVRTKEELAAYMDSFTLYGGGGTDFRPAFAYVMEKLQTASGLELKGLLYFTDGKGTFPKEKPPYDVAFVFLPDAGEDVQVPPWAIKVMLDEEEFHWI